MVRKGLICLVLVPLLASGSSDRIDSILTLQEDTNKVLRLSDLCFEYRGIDADSAILFGEMALALASDLDYPKGIAQAYNDLAIILMDKNDYAKAIEHLELALEIRASLKDSTGMAAVYNKLAVIHQDRYMLEQALEYNYKALDIFEKHGPAIYQAYVLNNIGALQFEMREYEQALATHQNVKEVRERLGDEFGLAATYGNIANCYLRMQDTAQAEANYLVAIEYFRRNDHGRELATQLHNLAGIYLPRNEPQKALDMFLEAYDLRMEVGDKRAISSTLASIGETLAVLRRYGEAKQALLGSLRMSRSIDGRSEIAYSLLRLAKLYGNLDQADSAVYYYDQYTAIKDTIFNNELSDQVAEVQIKYETAKKEKQILEQQVKLGEQETLNVALAGGVLILLLGGGFLFYRNKQREKQRLNSAIISQKEQGLKAVLHAQEAERRRIARELHDSVGQTLSGVKMAWQGLLADLKGTLGRSDQEKLIQTTNMLDEASSEVRTISHQMMPRALQETGLVPALQDLLDSALGLSSMEFSLEHHNADQRYPEEVEIGLYRVCQELLNNIIKHSEATEVSVQLIKAKNNLVLIVEDNGKGFNSSDDQEGIGLLNIQSRMETVHGEVNFGPSPGSGTVATIRVPIA